MDSHGPDFLFGSWSVHRFKLVHKLLPATIPPGAMPSPRPLLGAPTAHQGTSPSGMGMWAQQSPMGPTQSGPLGRPLLSPSPAAGTKAPGVGAGGGAVWSGSRPPSGSPIVVSRAPVPSWQPSTVSGASPPPVVLRLCFARCPIIVQAIQLQRVPPGSQFSEDGGSHSPLLPAAPSPGCRCHCSGRGSGGSQGLMREPGAKDESVVTAASCTSKPLLHLLLPPFSSLPPASLPLSCVSRTRLVQPSPTCTSLRWAPWAQWGPLPVRQQAARG